MDQFETDFSAILRPVKKLVIGACFLALAALLAKETGVFAVLQSNVALGKQAEGLFLLPTSQLLHPWGQRFAIEGRPVDLAFDSKKRVVAILNTTSVQIRDASTGTKIGEVLTDPTSYAGVAFRPGDRELWASETSLRGPDAMLVAEISELGMPGEGKDIILDGHPVPAGIAFSPDGATAYVAFSRNNSLAVIDARTRKITREIPVGIAPFGVAVSKQGTVYVSNRGGRRPRPDDTVAPSSGSQVVTDPVTGAAISGTVSVVNPQTSEVREVAVGKAPSGLALSPDEKTLVVANDHSDSVSLIDTGSRQATELKIPDYPESALGSQPIAVAFAPDGKTLYVACGGTNSLAVVRAGKWSVLGAIPTAWFPSAMAIGRDGSVVVVSIKGVGNTADGKGTFNSKQYEGALEKIAAPTAAQIAAGTREVKAANSPKFEPAGGVTNLPSLGIQHVFFIIKENRSYDEVLGDVPKGNGDPKLALYGPDITPNHHALAEEFVLLDNFYTSGAISFDGHHWLMQAFVSDYVERSFAAWPRGFAYNMADALTVAPTGFFWQSATKPVSVRIFGETCLPARWDPAQGVAVANRVMRWTEYWRLYKEGNWQTSVGCVPGVPAIGSLLSIRYPSNSTAIPDQLRADEFLRELAEREKTGEMPNIVVMVLNQDHTNGTTPGAPSPNSMMADNDLALGRVVEGISKSRFWSKSLILAVEDDAQDGLDHVDGHRTVALAVGPSVRRKAVDSNHYTHGSMVRTIQEIFRIPARTRFLQSARAMTSIFTPTPDLKPYQNLTPKVALDQMNPPLKALRGKQLVAARQSAAINWSDLDDIPAKVLSRILWWDAKGYDKPYPKR
jgi:YVTN family beta-propeller protein